MNCTTPQLPRNDLNGEEASALADDLRSVVAEFARSHGLSHREELVVLLTARGQSVRQIAQVTHCATSTIDVYWARIAGKTGVRSRNALAASLLRYLLRADARPSECRRNEDWDSRFQSIVRDFGTEHALSPRETQILTLAVVPGLANKETADALGRSTRTIEVLWAKIFRKTQTHARNEIVAVLLLRAVGRVRESSAPPPEAALSEMHK
jgi:DNA-binding NarL/FixJ family response regulator